MTQNYDVYSGSSGEENSLVVDVTMAAGQTLIAISSAQVALIDGMGNVTLIDMNTAMSQYGRENIIVPDPAAATPVSDDSIVNVSGAIVPTTPPGPIAPVPPSGPPPTIYVPKLPSGAPTVGGLAGLANKLGGRIAQILGKLGRAGKLIGPIAGIAAALLAAIAALQKLRGDPSKDTDKAGKYNNGQDPSPSQQLPGGGGAVGGTISEFELNKLANADFVEMMLALDCGQFTGIAACGCNPALRQALVMIETRFSVNEKQAIWRKACGCGVPNRSMPAPTPPISPPLIGPVIPTKYEPPNPNPPPGPTVVCDPSKAPQPGTYPTTFTFTKQA